MAAKRSRKVAYKVHDRPGLRHKLGDEEFTRKIGDDITVTVCKEAGQVVIYLDAPKNLKIVRQVAVESGRYTDRGTSSADNFPVRPVG